MEVTHASIMNGSACEGGCLSQYVRVFVYGKWMLIGDITLKLVFTGDISFFRLFLKDKMHRDTYCHRKLKLFMQ